MTEMLVARRLTTALLCMLVGCQGQVGNPIGGARLSDTPDAGGSVGAIQDAAGASNPTPLPTPTPNSTVPDDDSRNDAGSNSVPQGSSDGSTIPDASMRPQSDGSLVPDPDPIVPGAGGHPLADLAASMRAGDIEELTAADIPNSFFAGNGDPHTSYADSAAWDPVSECVYYQGAAHSGPTFMFRYCVSDNSWTEIPAFSDDVELIGHAYDNNGFDPEQRILYYRLYYSTRVLAYDVVNQSWSELPSYRGAASLEIAQASTFFPGVGVVVLSGSDRSVIAYDGDRWKTLAERVLDPTYHNFVEYSPAAGMIAFGGGNSSPKVWLMDRNGNTQRADDCPEVISTHNYGAGGNFTADPVSGDFIYAHTGGALYALSPETGEWSSLMSEHGMGHGDGMIAVPITSYGVIMFIRGTTSNNQPGHVYLYKHAE